MILDIHEINNLVLPKMLKKKFGRIIHISSIAIIFFKGNAPYISAKYALEGYVKSVSKEISKKMLSCYVYHQE